MVTRGYALFSSQHLAVSAYYLYSRLLAIFRCQIQFVIATIVILSSCTISRKLRRAAEFCDV
jgi:hypothetical protein